MRFVIATHNRKKREELSRILSVLDIVAVTGEEVGVSLTEPEETGTTFEENQGGSRLPGDRAAGGGR